MEPQAFPCASATPFAAATSCDSLSPAHEVIGQVYAQMRTFMQEQSFDPAQLLSKIQGDSFSVELKQLMLKTCLVEEYVLCPHLKTSGVVVLVERDTGLSFGVFKIGRKRANMETFGYKLAQKLKLEDHAIPSAFCALENPSLPLGHDFENQEIYEELFNGFQKNLLIQYEVPEPDSLPDSYLLADPEEVPEEPVKKRPVEEN
ncbi:MAG: hypothetical protein EBU93_03315, partial [Chlamydiae bacterium]|nr:hypothetical protein [Chlamydiota bacterium]